MNKHETFCAGVRRGRKSKKGICHANMKKEVTLNNSESDPPTQQTNIPEDISVPTQQNNNASEEVPSPTQPNNSVHGDVPGCSKVFKPLDNKNDQEMNNSLFSEIELSTKIQKTRSITAKLAL